MEKSGVADIFKDGTVFITGGTGFLGKLLIEKLLRSCPVKTIAILVRSKRGLDANQRVADIFKQSLFNRLQEEKPNFMEHIKIIDGDLDESSLNLSSANQDWIMENVNFIFHCAATIKFNEPLKFATKINVLGTEHMLTIAFKMRNLKGFVHVSTAYSHCPKNEIREQYYSTPVTIKELKNITNVESYSSKILGDWPNTYSFTKAIAENLISANVNNLPLSIFRPSIVACTKSEPNPGWLENMNGPSGIITGAMVGFLRTFPVQKEKVTDIVPADYTVNALISVMWDTVNSYQDADHANKEPKIYNYVSSAESPITWKKLIDGMAEHYNTAPPLQAMWYIFYVFYTNVWIGSILKFVLHRVPAAFVDFLLITCRKKPKMLKMYAKTEQMMDMLYNFSTKQWEFDNTNIRKLWSSMSSKDSKTFWFSLEDFNWESYSKNFYYGIRENILHENLDNIPKALAKNQKLFWLHYTFTALIVYLIVQVCWMLVAHLY